MDLIKVTKNIEKWANERNLHKAEPSKQMLKVVEELGELSEGIAKDNVNAQIDGLGDLYVTLVILSMQLELELQDCIEFAYHEIADRKGKIINGVFVKEEDL